MKVQGARGKKKKRRMMGGTIVGVKKELAGQEDRENMGEREEKGSRRKN